jgi:uncharacterized membrane protein (DUF2068 family)
MSPNTASKATTAAAKRRRRNRILLLIAGYKFLKALAFIITGIALLNVLHVDLLELVQRYIYRLHLDPRSQGAEWILRNVAHIEPRQIGLVALAFFIYAAIFIIEGVGLYFQQVWAEWLVIIEAALLCPLEVLEIQRHPDIWHVLILLINLTIVFYLLLLRTGPFTKKMMSLFSAKLYKNKPH